MRRRTQEHSAEDEALVFRIFELLKTHVVADPHGWDGSFAREIRNLPPGLRAMAATQHLGVSLTSNDIGWHFVNFGEPDHVEETKLGLLELGLSDLAALFHEAYDMVRPHLAELRRPGRNYQGIMQRSGQTNRIHELTSKARAMLGEQGIYRHWAAYAREHPDEHLTPDAAQHRLAPTQHRLATRGLRRGVHR